MLRFPVVFSLAVCLMFAVLSAQPAAAQTVPGSNSDPPDLHIAPYLQNVKPDGITVMWETTGPVPGAVDFGRNGSFEQTVEEPEGRTIHELHLTGLEPSTTYNYRARYAEHVLAAATFTTAPPPGTPNWRLVVYGDSRSNPNTHGRNVQQIMKLKPGIILNTGDLVADGSKYEQWKPQYFDPMRGVSEYVPIFPCLGIMSATRSITTTIIRCQTGRARSTTRSTTPMRTSSRSTATRRTRPTPSANRRPSG